MPVTRLTPEQTVQFGHELDALRRRVTADLGQSDADYIHGIVAVQRRCEVAGRILLFAGWFPPAWLAGVAALSVSKILDNMEIGHNVMHGQYDWMQDPTLHSQRFEWDMVCPADHWRRSHNYLHHTYTNVLDKDRDVGFGVLRVTADQPWHPYYLGNPVYAAAHAVAFEWGVLLYDLEIDRIVRGQRSWTDTRPLWGPILRKTGRQVAKDYLLFPLLTGPLAPLTLAANASATIVRNLWAFAIIYCGHFPPETEVFTEEQIEHESRGQWYLRQLLGSANITGGPLFHILSGNLGHQIEHHLFPTLPACRYAEVAEQVRDLCRRYDLPYHTGSLTRQLGSAITKIVKLALPWGHRTATDPATVDPTHDAAA